MFNKAAPSFSYNISTYCFFGNIILPFYEVQKVHLRGKKTEKCLVHIVWRVDV